MPCSSLRLHLENGYYYIVHRGNGGQPIFSTDEDYGLFELTLAAALKRWRAQVHAFCWLPKSLYLLLQIADGRVGRVVQYFSCRYARAINSRSGVSGSIFRPHFEAILIEPEPRYLLKAVRHIHEAPIRANVVTNIGDFARSSHAAYASSASIPWLTTSVILQMLAQDEDEAKATYRSSMQAPMRLEDTEIFHRDKREDPRVLGSAEFLRNLPRFANSDRTTASLERICASVAVTLGMDRREILSRSGLQEAPLARALIASHAIERGVATLTEVAQYLDRAPSSLREAIRYHREQRPELFRPDGLRGAAPLLPNPPVAKQVGIDSTAEHRIRHLLKSPAGPMKQRPPGAS